MKKLLFILAVFVYFFGLHEIAAQDTSKILISKKDLTQEQLQKYETNKTVETLSQWVGLGKEIGVAMNEGLTALTTTAVNFSETELGRFTMFVIAWKVLGKDVMRIFIALPAWLLLMGIFTWSYKRTYPRKILRSKTLTDKRFLWIFPVYDNFQYEIYKIEKDSYGTLGPNGIRALHALFALIFTIPFLIVMFA
jgi:hypothetical protein